MEYESPDGYDMPYLLTKLKKNPSNPRLIRDARFDALKRSLQEFPQMMVLRPLIVDSEGVVLGGNMRLEVLKALGFKEVPDEWVRKADELTPEQKREFVIKDNSSFGEYDWDLLANEWSDLPLSDWGVDLPEDWLTQKGVEEEESAVGELIDKAAELQQKWGVVTGGIYQIGRHRLMCGDSTKAEDVARLMDGRTAVVFTDPPYGLNVVKDNMVGADFGIAQKGKYAEVVGDATTDTAKHFFAISQRLGFTKFIIWGGNYFADFLPFSCGWIIWDKRGDSGIKNTFADGEMAWTNLQRQVRIYTQLWNGMIREGESGKRLAPTQKPIKLTEQIITDFCPETEAIYDGFVGSGTTLIAAENLNRKCYAMEITPAYCAVSLERIAVLGLEAKRLE